MATRTNFFEALTDNRVDTAANMLRGVCVVRVGEARGHKVFIDRKTLETVCDVGNSSSEGIKVKLRHSMPGVFQSVLEESFGLLKNFSIAGDKVIANLEILQSVDDKIKAKAFEMASKMANQFGLSIDYEGHYEKIGDKDFLRCERLGSVDLTDKPAATDGLFSMKEPKFKNGTEGEHHSDCACDQCEKKKFEAGGASGAKPLDAKVEEKMEALAAQVKQLSDMLTKLTPASGQFEALAARVEKAEKFANESLTKVATQEKKTIIGQMEAAGRVAINPETSKAYTREQLEALDVPMLKFAAVNSQVLLTQARAVYSSTGTGPQGGKFTKIIAKRDGGTMEVLLRGSELTEAAWEKYNDMR